MGVYDCVVPKDVTFTFKDEPYNYASDLLASLKMYGAKATL